MMKLRSDLPIKYHLNVYREEELQDSFVILFDLVQYLIKVMQLKNKSVTLEGFKFSSKSLKYVFGEKVNDEVFKQKLIATIKELISSKDIEVDGSSMYITKKGLTNFYLIE